MVSVSLIGDFVVMIGLCRPVAGDAVAAVGPPREILELTPFAAEGTPCGIDRMLAAERAEV